MPDNPTLRVLDPKEWLTRKEASRYFCARGVPLNPRSLQRMASFEDRRAGPPYTRVRGNLVRYHKSDLDEWIAKNVERIT